MKKQQAIASVRHWVESFVIGNNLCPFAGREFLRDRVRFSYTDAGSEPQLLNALADEIRLLNQNLTIETTLLIHPEVLQDFTDYNQFLEQTERLLEHLELTGVYQIASFHPDYQFSGSKPSDAENYTNRSPYPLIHLLREQSVEQAIISYPDISTVPTNNIALMNQLGADTLSKMMQGFLRPGRKEGTKE
ncbi:MAG: DUF1415 domain-containing protein [Proteobacteria bacterium]|nr:DUF1415 domain-containing protein [Pseudomonadota bacterium]